MKKTIAMLISIVLLLGVFAGCGAQKPVPTTPATGDVSNPMAAGLLVLNAGAAVNISYDADALVLNVEGINDNGTILAAEYTDFLGKSCTDAVCDLIAASSSLGFLNNESTYVMLKQAVGSALPGATFLETIQKDAEEAITSTGFNAKLVMLTEENLDEDGYINLESAKQLMLAYLGLDAFDTLNGTSTPTNGLYNFRVTAGDMTDDLIIDGVNGDVYQGVLEDASLEETQDDAVDTADPTDEVIVEAETAAPTQAPEDIVNDPDVDPTTEPTVGAVDEPTVPAGEH